MKYKKLKLFFLFTFLSVQLSISQDIEAIKNADIDSYSDEQIEMYWNKAKEQGLDLEKLELISKSKGVSALQFSKLRSRILSLKSSSSNNKSVTEDANQINTSSKIGLDGTENKELFKKSLLFGYDFFNNPSISFTPNLNVATPTTYQLGPGDEILIEIWGASENTYSKKVNRQGAIRIDGIGPIYVTGLSIDKAKKKILSYLKKIYNGIDVANSSTNKVYAEVSLVGIRTVQVNIIGEVKVPGSYNLNALSTVLNGLYASGGPTVNGSFRNIKIIRGGSDFAEFDIYKYLMKGSGEGNILLQDQDIILIPSYESKIQVEGKVKRPGIFELKEGENIQDLINYFSGFEAEAYKDRLLVQRINGKEKEVLEVSLNQQEDFAMQDGDILTISEIIDRFKNKISISGSVYRPGDYQLTDGLTLSALIDKAAGIKKDAFLERGIIYRNIDDIEEEILSFSLNDILEKESDILLEREDRIVILSKSNLIESSTLTINGAINKPQVIPFVDKMTLQDFIAISEGFKDGADVNQIDVFRRLNNGSFENISEQITMNATSNLEKNSNFQYLKPFDIVSVRYKKGFSNNVNVTIKGEISYPGSYSLTTRNDRISDLINRSGGLSPYAFKEGATLIRSKDKITKELESDLLDSIVVEEKVVFNIGIDLPKIMSKAGKNSKYDLILQQGDQLIIPSKTDMIEVQGQVLSPSLIRYEPNKSLKEYINNSGGFSDTAKKSKIYVTYANGDIKSTKHFLFFKTYPKIRSGSTILVPEKIKKEGIGVQGIVGLTTSLATLGVLINTLLAK